MGNTDDYGWVFIMITLIGVAMIFFMMGFKTEVIVDCSQIPDDCFKMNRYYMACPEIWDRMGEIDCPIMNVTHFPMKNVNYEIDYDEEINWSFE